MVYKSNFFIVCPVQCTALDRILNQFDVLIFGARNFHPRCI